MTRRDWIILCTAVPSLAAALALHRFVLFPKLPPRPSLLVDAFGPEPYGQWVSPTSALNLHRNGLVDYLRAKPRVHGNHDDYAYGYPVDFRDGWLRVVSDDVIPLDRRVHIDRAPHRDGDDWKMSVEGVELTRVQLFPEVHPPTAKESAP